MPVYACAFYAFGLSGVVQLQTGKVYLFMSFTITLPPGDRILWILGCHVCAGNVLSCGAHSSKKVSTLCNSYVYTFPLIIQAWVANAQILNQKKSTE